MALILESVAEATSGVIGALVSTAVLYPLDTCKTNYQDELRTGHHQKYRHVSDVKGEAISTRQILSLYQGLVTKNLYSFISQFVYFYGCNFFKRLYLKNSGSKAIGGRANLLVAIAAAACTVIVIQICSSSALLLMVKEKITKSTWVILLAVRRFLLLNRIKLKGS